MEICHTFSSRLCEFSLKNKGGETFVSGQGRPEFRGDLNS